jgi:hypothetical protein
VVGERDRGDDYITITIDRYSHFLPQAESEAADRLESYLEQLG